MSGLFDNLAFFFEGLFTSDPEALQAKRRLRALAESLEEIRPPVFAARTDLILPGFAQSWGTVHSLLQPLKDLFERTLVHSDRKVRDQCLGFLIESVLVGDIADRRQALSLEAIQDRLARSGDPGREASAVTGEFNSLLMDLRRQDAEKIQRDFEGLFRLQALTAHSLVPLLNRFGYDSAAPVQQYRALAGASALTDLMDLYFIVEGLDLGPGVEQLLGLLLEKMNPGKAPENRRKTSAVLGRIRDLGRGPCSPHLLLGLIRVFQKEPDSRPDTLRFTERYIQVYSATLAERFTRDRDRAVQEQGESHLEADIAALFPGTTLLTLGTYNAATSSRLTDAGLPGLNLVKPFQILRSFGFAVLKTGYLDAVKKVVLSGAFLEKAWADRLGDALTAADGVLGRLEAFDHGLVTDPKAGLPPLEKYLGGKVPVSSVSKALVDKLNRHAQSVLEGEVQVLSVLAQRVQEILADYKNPQPLYVTNIKVLGGKDQRALAEALIGGYNRTAQLLRILKTFIVVK